MTESWKRRRFLQGMGAAGAATAGGACTPPPGEASSPDEATPRGASNEVAERPEDGSEAQTNAASGQIPRRSFGSTNETVSALGLGGFHIGVPSEKEAIEIMHRAIDSGITFFDNCWDYHEGESERRMGKALAGGRRDQVFLMTKIDGRTRKAAADQIDDCLRRLRTDRVDLMQIHEVIREKDTTWVFGEDGAVQALRDAQKAGKIRYTGFTGHKSPSIHLSMLEAADEHDFRYDAVQMPLNVLDPHYDSFEKKVLPVLQKKGIAVLGMKALASGAALEGNVVTAEECLRYALSLPTSVVITGCDEMKILEQAISVGRSFTPLDEEERVALLARTAPYGDDGGRELFKTSSRFDATLRNKHWLTTGNL